MDQTYNFVPHSDYVWLTGLRRPGGAIVFDRARGWEHFVVPVSEAERVWEGVTQEPEGRNITELDHYVSGGGRAIHLGGHDTSPTREFEAELWHIRRPKDGEEIALMRQAAEATRAGHARAAELAHPGITEHQLKVEMESEFMRNGATGTGYGSIVGFGDHAAVLHFQPTHRQLRDEELVLIDAGAQAHGYVIDVTRTYRCNSATQQELYAIVRQALTECNAMCTPGTEWVDVHRHANMVIADGLHQMGVLNVNAELACESGAVATFMPHGVGHAVGLGVRDCSGPLPGREPGSACGSNVRCNFPLAPGYVMTVEPGCYFVAPLLHNAERRAKFATEINWDRAESLIPLGGVRLEDNLLVTEGEPQNLTSSIPL